jgi:hypothetical protein
VGIFVVVLGAGAASGKVFFSQAEALELAFPGAERVERRNFVLDEAQVAAIQERSRAPLESRIVTLHVGLGEGGVLGYAVIDVHTVRTLPEALMTVLTPDGVVRSVRLLAFHEPLEYAPTGRWFTQFDGKRLAPELQLKRDIHAIAGATLSSRATTRSVRRALALWQVLIDEPARETTGD